MSPSLFPIRPIHRTHKNEAPREPHFLGRHVLVCAGGVEPDPQSLLPWLADIHKVIAADGGWRLTKRLNLACDLLLGDFDTLSASELSTALEEGTETRQYPTDKSQSDLEIALLEAIQLGADRISIVGALGGEWDHCVANLLAPLSLCAERGVWARLLSSEAQIYLCTDAVEVQAQGCRLSLAALSASVEGLSLKGFQYGLEDETLSRSQTMGLANVALENSAQIEFLRGELLLTLLPRNS